MLYLVSLVRFTAGGSKRGGEGTEDGKGGERDDEWEGRMGIAPWLLAPWGMVLEITYKLRPSCENHQ